MSSSSSSSSSTTISSTAPKVPNALASFTQFQTLVQIILKQAESDNAAWLSELESKSSSSKKRITPQKIASAILSSSSVRVLETTKAMYSARDWTSRNSDHNKGKFIRVSPAVLDGLLETARKMMSGAEISKEVKESMDKHRDGLARIGLGAFLHALGQNAVVDSSRPLHTLYVDLLKKIEGTDDPHLTNTWRVKLTEATKAPQAPSCNFERDVVEALIPPEGNKLPGGPDVHAWDTVAALVSLRTIWETRDFVDKLTTLPQDKVADILSAHKKTGAKRTGKKRAASSAKTTSTTDSSSSSVEESLRSIIPVALSQSADSSCPVANAIKSYIGRLITVALELKP